MLGNCTASEVVVGNDWMDIKVKLTPWIEETENIVWEDHWILWSGELERRKQHEEKILNLTWCLLETAIEYNWHMHKGKFFKAGQNNGPGSYNNSQSSQTARRCLSLASQILWPLLNTQSIVYSKSAHYKKLKNKTQKNLADYQVT